VKSSQSRRMGEETYSFPLSGIEPIFLSRPAIFVVSNLIEVNWLLYCTWVMDICRGGTHWAGNEGGGGG
jgi:hypothetical protein